MPNIIMADASGYVANDWLDPTKPVGEISSDAVSFQFNLLGHTGITGISLPNVTTLPAYFLQGCTGLVSFSAPNLTSCGQSLLSGCTSITSDIILPNCPVTTDMCRGTKAKNIVVKNEAGAVSNAFRDCSELEAVDIGTGTSCGNDSFANCAKLKTIILRSSSICTLNKLATLTTNTPFKSGGSGGTIYIPKSLYDHLGDGTADDYKAATYWSTIDGYGTITWAQIEGSYYETHYAGGTPIPSA